MLSRQWFYPPAGADEMIDLIAKTFISKGSEVVLAEITFPRYLSTSQMMGAALKIVPMDNLAYDLAAFKKAVTPDTRLVWLCNPNKPHRFFFQRGRNSPICLEFIPPETL